MPYRGAHRVAHAEVEAALLVHGIVQTRELRQRRPVVVEGVVAQTVVGAGSGDDRSETHTLSDASGRTVLMVSPRKEVVLVPNICFFFYRHHISNIFIFLMLFS